MMRTANTAPQAQPVLNETQAGTCWMYLAPNSALQVQSQALKHEPVKTHTNSSMDQPVAIARQIWAVNLAQMKRREKNAQ
jgi:hypothetical protein